MKLNFKIKVSPDFLIPLVIAGCSSYYLYQIFRMNSEYNYSFVIPIIVILILFCLVECIRSAAFNNGFSLERNQPEFKILKLAAIPELRFAAVVVIYIYLFQYVTFLLLSFMFLLLSPTLFKTVKADRVVSLKWLFVSAIITVSTYLFFNVVLSASLK